MNNIYKNFFNTLEKMQANDSYFSEIDFTLNGFCLNLKYNRKTFIYDIKNILSKYSLSERQKLEQQHNFKLVLKDTFDTIEGYPCIYNNGDKNLNTIIDKFFYQNEFLFSTEYPKELCQNLNTITAALPEFLLLIGKAQHRTHSYSVDIHTLKVLQEVFKDTRYSSLNENDKKALQITVLLHDLTKKEFEIDKTHPSCAAKDTKNILQRFDIQDSIKEQACLLIKNHDWLERYNKKITSTNELAHVLKDGNNFLMECIIATADLKAVQRDGIFYEKFKNILQQGEKQITAIINSNINAA